MFRRRKARSVEFVHAVAAEVAALQAKEPVQMTKTQIPRSLSSAELLRLGDAQWATRSSELLVAAFGQIGRLAGLAGYGGGGTATLEQRAFEHPALPEEQALAVKRQVDEAVRCILAGVAETAARDR
jgi:hypothetical protein